MSIKELLDNVKSYDEVYIYGARLISGTVYDFLTHQLENFDRFISAVIKSCNLFWGIRY
mgnify:CR=1 FL=1